jgi:hypothetical protein
VHQTKQALELVLLLVRLAPLYHDALQQQEQLSTHYQ